MRLSIIIVNYNVKYFLEQCLCSVLNATRNIGAEIIVVDNNSTDGSKQFFAGKFPGVRFVWNQVNSGFSKANNLGQAAAAGEYLLFLNPDTIIPEDCIEKCLDFFGTHPQAGALGVRMIDGAGNFLKESKRAFPSPLTSLYKLTELARLFPRSRTFAQYHLGNLDEHANHEVDVLAGAFMMIPSVILKKIGGFDEAFFMYGEDVDLSYRIQKAGYKNYYFSGTSIIHFKGESTRKGSLNYVRLFYKAMSIFVQKHYGGSKAGIFNALIQVAIFMRATLSATGRFIKWLGMPLMDAGIILGSFWLVKWLWSYYVKKEVNYAPNMLLIAFPVFTLIFLIASYYSGLYDNSYRQSRLNRSTGTAFIILLIGYALLPESLRFSRGILVFGSLLGYLLMTIFRWWLVKQQVIESGNEDDEHRQTVIVGTDEEFRRVGLLMHDAGMEERVLGRVEVNGIQQQKSIGHTSQLKPLLSMYPIKEVVFCEGRLKFSEMIPLIEEVPKHIRIRIHASCSEGLVGSDNKDVAGGYISKGKNFRLTNPVNKRTKNLVAVLISIAFILTFPVHFILQKNSLRFFKNVFAVLFAQKTWVGYSSKADTLPQIKNGVLTSTGLPAKLNLLPGESLKASDIWYAKEYSTWLDLKLVWRGYKYLGIV